jgi:hypothetical protein
LFSYLLLHAAVFFRDTKDYVNFVLSHELPLSFADSSIISSLELQPERSYLLGCQSHSLAFIVRATSEDHCPNDVVSARTKSAIPQVLSKWVVLETYHFAFFVAPQGYVVGYVNRLNVSTDRSLHLLERAH